MSGDQRGDEHYDKESNEETICYDISGPTDLGRFARLKVMFFKYQLFPCRDETNLCCPMQGRDVKPVCSPHCGWSFAGRNLPLGWESKHEDSAIHKMVFPVVLSLLNKVVWDLLHSYLDHSAQPCSQLQPLCNGSHLLWR